MQHSKPAFLARPPRHESVGAEAATIELLFTSTNSVLAAEIANLSRQGAQLLTAN